MAAQLAHTTRQIGPNRTPRARHYSDALWREYYAEVHRLYLDPLKPCTLEEMGRHFRVKYGFCPSKKQWKERLNKWKIQRNLDLRIAAIILFLLQEAARDGLHRRVWHNNREKTAKDIASYITKSAKISSPEQLLTQLPPRSDWPRSVRYVDEAVSNHCATSTAPEAGTSGVSDAHASFQPSPSIAADIFGLQAGQSLSQQPFSLPSGFVLPPQPFDELEAARDTFDTSFDDSLTQLDYDMSQEDWDTHQQQAQQDHVYQQWGGLENHGLSGTQSEWQQYPVSQSQAATVNNANNSGPHQARSPQMAQPQRSSAASVVWNTLQSPERHATYDSLQLGMFNAAASATPVSVADVPEGSKAKLEQQLDKQVRDLMGSIEDLGPVPSEHFTYHCCEAMLYAARDAARQRDQAIRKATNAFREMLSTRKGYSTTLPLLNRLSFIAEAYGHRALKHLILQSLRQTLHRGVAEKLHRDLLQDVFDLLLDTAEWFDTKPAANKARADQIYDAAVKVTGITSKFAIAARYNQAWVLLENEQFRDALDILLQESSRCESVFGTYDLQTICWLATLARAHLMSGEALRALSLMRESVVIRAEHAFNRNHPLYWEIRHRIGLFLCKLAKDNTIPNSTEDFWREGETRLTETLMWRAENLGPDNSQTLKALRLLNSYLRKQGKPQDAEDLVRSYRAEASDD